MNADNPRVNDASGSPTEKAARAFFATLTDEGFTHEQVVHLANELLGLVHDELADGNAPLSK